MSGVTVGGAVCAYRRLKGWLAAVGALVATIPAWSPIAGGEPKAANGGALAMRAGAAPGGTAANTDLLLRQFRVCAAGFAIALDKVN